MRKKKIKILHVAQAAGGVDRYIRMLLKYLDKEMFENILVCSQDFHEEDYRGLVDSFEQVEMKRDIGGNDLKAIREVRALIKKYNPDIVYLPISDDYYIGALNKEEENDIKLYNNHSCDPNCGMHGEITFVAIRDINPDEELTVDYAFIDNEDYSFECTCGSPYCRHTVTGFDWKIKELQTKYYPYFAQYLKDKIDIENLTK